jgi:hypothetical protein
VCLCVFVCYVNIWVIFGFTFCLFTVANRYVEFSANCFA